MSAVVNTGLLTKGLRSEFFERHNQVHSAEAAWPELCTTLASKADSETYKFLGSIPQPREWGQGRIAKGVLTESYSVTNEKYESTMEIDRDEIADDQTGQIMIRAQELGERAARYKDYQIETLLQNGSTAGYNSYDGVPFFDASHVSGASGSQANEFTFDVGAVLPNMPDLVDDPAPAQLLAAFDQCVEKLMTWKDDKGVIERRGPGGLVVCCHVKNWRKWLTAIGGGMISAPALATSGGASTVNVQTVIPRILPMAGLTDKSKFFVLRTDSVIRPFIFQDREPMEVVSITKGSDEEFFREKYYFGTRSRYKLTYGEWKHAVSCDLTT